MIMVVSGPEISHGILAMACKLVQSPPARPMSCPGGRTAHVCFGSSSHRDSQNNNKIGKIGAILQVLRAIFELRALCCFATGVKTFAYHIWCVCVFSHFHLAIASR